ncbi:MAG: reverse transcriptase domain-containing protein [Bacteroidales bacterium]|nr:reverse transcriptase domain-containing protein [Bacteroidales bacterium]
MDREFIINYHGDFLTLLNKVKKVMLEENGMGDLFHPFSLRQITYYSNPNHTKNRYQQFEIKKKTGGMRLITAPRNKTFKMILQCLNEIFKAIYTPSDYAMGFTEGRSIVTNASIHKNHNYVLNIDLKDFFPSITQSRICNRLKTKPFEFPDKIALVISGLCCMKITTKDENGNDVVRYVLPQGAPTSPVITNMICDKLDRRLAGVAKRFGLKYSRYADDITFSSMHNVYQKDGEFWNELNRVITAQGFSINEKKTRLQTKRMRQEVTGIVVNKKLNVLQKYVRNIRNILYIWGKYGFIATQSRFLPKYKADKGHVKKVNPDMINVLEGKLLYLKMVKGEDDSVYQRLREKFDKLKNDALSILKTNTYSNVTYIETLPLSVFEKDNAEVVITYNETKHKRYAFFKRNDKKEFVSVSKDITAEEEKTTENFAISLCQDANGKRFWLLHKKTKITVPTYKPVDLDELNNDLDSLLNI